MAADDLVDRVHQTVKTLNPSALIVRTSRSRIDLAHVLNTKRFSMEKAEAYSGWMTVLRGTAPKPESEEYGITSFIYRARKPFHPLRLHALLAKEQPLVNVVRSKGFCWIGSHNSVLCEWASAGRMYSVEPAAKWFTCTAPDTWGEGVDRQAIFKDFDNSVGDRRQEIVFIGLRLDRQRITDTLNACLLTDDEFANPDWIERLAELKKNPFQFLDVIEHEEHEEEEEHEHKRHHRHRRGRKDDDKKKKQQKKQKKKDKKDAVKSATKKIKIPKLRTVQTK